MSNADLVRHVCVCVCMLSLCAWIKDVHSNPYSHVVANSDGSWWLKIELRDFCISDNVLTL